jgi:hypothetical protein
MSCDFFNPNLRESMLSVHRTALLLVLPVIILLLMMCSSSSWATESNLLSATFSPKLRTFLTANPAAFKAMTNALFDTFSNRTFQIFYFYSDDESTARASHFYPNQEGLAQVVISARENQDPLDEFISVFYETINSRGETQFGKVLQDARSGILSRDDFARAILKLEFDAVRKTRDAIKALKFSEKETSKSHYYRVFVECPDNFEESLAYSKKISPTRDAFKEYQLKYDAYRKAYKDYEMKRDASK